MAFNSFLSTSKDPDVALLFTECNEQNPTAIAILFVMTIDPSKSRTAFASAKEIGHFGEEAEILFSMHTVFRICEVKQIDASKRLWQVKLTLTSDDDEDLRALTQRLSEETFPESDGWQRLSSFLFKIGRPEKAEQILEVSLKYTHNQHKRTVLKHQLGWANDCQGKDHEAIRCFEESIAAMEKTRSADDPELASSYNGLANVYNKRGEHWKALLYYEEALKIQHQNHPSNHPALAVTYNNIGAVYQNMKDYSKALSYYEKALAIQQQNLPLYHPDLSVSHYNIGAAHHNKGDYSEALFFYEIALDIQQKALPPNHPDLIRVNDQIDSVQRKLQGRSSGASNRSRNTRNSTVNYSSN
jgi:tetratricopeptide (TPR) repeat protein